MAKIFNNKISLSFDIYGCPNMCKNCWIGHPKHNKMNVNEVISTFSNIKNEQNSKKYYNAKIEYIDVGFREPHYGDDYKKLYNRVDEVNNCVLEVDSKFELISLWRLGNDSNYIKWIRERGIKRAQLKVFGLEKTNDFFYGKKGAHQELINGTNILLENGIVPRWQVYLNKMGINELRGVLELTKVLNVEKRVQELGENFNIKGAPYDSTGAGYDNNKFRIEKKDLVKIPSEIINIASLKTEKELIKKIINNDDKTVMPNNHNLWFYITSNWDVYPNFMGIAPWWKLGNLKSNSWKSILNTYVENNNKGLRIMNEITTKELIQKCGDKNSEKIFSGVGQFEEYLVEKYCREIN